MPVLRKRERVQMQVGLSPVSARENPLVASLGQQAADMARRASAYGSAMAIAAEDEAKALVRAAVMTEDENGIPRLPPNPTLRMGRIAQRTYDAGIADRMVHQLSTAVGAIVTDVENENLYDPQAFSDALGARLDEFGANIPPEFGGTVQDLAANAAVQAGGNVGRRSAELSMEDARTRIPSQIADATAQISQSILAGDMDGADALIEEAIAMVNRTSDVVMNAGEKAKAVEGFYFDAGYNRLLYDSGISTATALPSEIMDLHDRLLSGEDPDLLSYFLRPGLDAPDMDMAEKAAFKLVQLAGGANKRLAAENDRAEKTGKVNLLLQGYAPDNAQYQELGDEVLGRQLDLRTENGAARPMAPEDWLSMDQAQLASAMQQVKGTGIVPTSMRQLFTKLERGNDPAQMVPAFYLWRDLREQATEDGVTVNLNEVVPKRLQSIFGLVDVSHGSGSPTEDGIALAMNTITALEQQPWDDGLFAAKVSADASFTSELWNGKTTADNVNERATELIRDKVFEGGVASQAQEAEALAYFQTMLRTKLSVDDALAATHSSFAGRLKESRYMTTEGRNAYAPERYYPAQTDGSMKELFSSWRDLMKEKGIELDGKPESGARANGMMSANPMSGAASAALSPGMTQAGFFDLLADTEIKKILKATPRMADAMGVNVDQAFFRAGVDYSLEFARWADGRPVYKVFIENENGRRVPLPGELDVRKNYDQFVKTSELAASIDTARRTRLAQAMMEASIEGRDLTDEEINKIIHGNTAGNNAK